MSPSKLISPAFNLLTLRSEPPDDTLAVTYLPIAFCVGTILFELAANVTSVLNSLTTAPVPPSTTPPSLSSSRPSSSKKLALILIVPVSYTHLTLPTNREV